MKLKTDPFWSYRAGLARTLYPETIAFVGGAISETALKNCLQLNFSGDIWPVNPKRTEMAGIPCFRSVSDLPKGPDVAFLAVGPQQTIEITAKLSAASAGSAICYSAGFAEIGHLGKERQSDLIAAAESMPVIGPNCAGLVNLVDGASCSPFEFSAPDASTGVALISQSGGIMFSTNFSQRSIPFTHLVTVGNQAMVSIADWIDVLLFDDRVKTIGLYVESISDPDRFIAAVMRAQELGVPIVVLHPEDSETAVAASQSHTAGLITSYELFDVFFESLNVISTTKLNAFYEALKICAVGTIPRGRRCRLLVFSGGDSCLAAAAAINAGLELEPVPALNVSELQSQLPDFVTVRNPLDLTAGIWNLRDGAMRDKSVRDYFDGEFDIGVVAMDLPNPDRVSDFSVYEQFLCSLLDAASGFSGRLFYVSMLPECLGEVLRRRFLDAGIAPLQGVHDGFTALGLVARYGIARKSLSCGKKQISLLRTFRKADEIVTAYSEFEAKSKLARYGLSVPNSAETSAASASLAAERIGFPVALKFSSSEVLHKTEIGAVKLDLASQSSVTEAAAEILRAVPESHLDVDPQFLVEKMVEGKVLELIIGIKHDPVFGLVLLVGAGGMLAEFLRDTRKLILPVEREQVVKAISELRIATLIGGHRGAPAADLDAAVDAIMSLVAYAVDNREGLLEIEVNPLILRARGQGAVAADLVLRHVDTGQS